MNLTQRALKLELDVELETNLQNFAWQLEMNFVDCRKQYLDILPPYENENLCFKGTHFHTDFFNGLPSLLDGS